MLILAFPYLLKFPLDFLFMSI